jgi:hypothetical protein
MTVKQLRKIIDAVPDETHVVLRGSDHSFRLGHATPDYAAVPTTEKRPHTFYEWYGDQEHYEEPMRVVDVLVIE